MSRRPTLLALALGVLGCKIAGVHVVDPGAPTPPAGYTLAKDDASGVSVYYPQGWQTGRFPAAVPFSPSGGADASGVNSSGQDASASSVASGLTPTSTPDNTGANGMGAIGGVNIGAAAPELGGTDIPGAENDHATLEFNNGVKPLPSEENTRFFVQVVQGESSMDGAVDQLKQEMAFPHTSDVVTPLGRAVKITSNYTNKIGDKQHEIAYVWVDGDRAYRLRFKCTGDATPISSVADDVMQTLRIRPPKS